MKKRMEILLLLFIMSLLQLGCNKTEPEQWCLDAPCGELVGNETNLTVSNTSQSDISAMAIILDGEEYQLANEGWDFENGKGYTCWQQIPAITSESNLIFLYVLEGEEVIGFLNTVGAQGNALVIEINGEDAILTTYQECIDVQ